jgi:hypothetical protein
VNVGVTICEDGEREIAVLGPFLDVIENTQQRLITIVGLRRVFEHPQIQRSQPQRRVLLEPDCGCRPGGCGTSNDERAAHLRGVFAALGLLRGAHRFAQR